MRVFEKDYHNKFGGIGIVIYPYQIAFGVSFRFWKQPSGTIFNIYTSAIAFRIYFLMFKLWGYITLKREKRSSYG